MAADATEGAEHHGKLGVIESIAKRTLQQSWVWEVLPAAEAQAILRNYVQATEPPKRKSDARQQAIQRSNTRTASGHSRGGAF